MFGVGTVFTAPSLCLFSSTLFALAQLALLHNAPRAATVTAETDCTVFSLDEVRNDAAPRRACFDGCRSRLWHTLFSTIFLVSTGLHITLAPFSSRCDCFCHACQQSFVESFFGFFLALVWQVSFKMILMGKAQADHDTYLSFLKEVPILKHLSEEDLKTMAGALTEKE